MKHDRLRSSFRFTSWSYSQITAVAVSIGLSGSGAIHGNAWALTPGAHNYYLQAVQAEHRGNLKEAEQALRKTITLDPQDYLNAVKLAAILNQLGKPNEAASYYRQALTLNPQDMMILYSLGGIYEQLGQYTKAEEAYTLTLRNNPGYRFALLNLARTEIQQKKYAPAITHYHQFLESYPDHFEARRRLARLYLATGKMSEAVQQYERLKMRFPNQFADHVDLARALNGANDPAKALAELQLADGQEGGKADISEEMGRAHAALGQGELAILNFRKAYALNPQKEELLLRIGDLQRERKQWNEAIESYQTFLKLHPDNRPVRRTLADTYLENRQYEAALSELDGLLSQLDPGRADQAAERYALQKDQAYAMHMMGDLPKAIALYEALRQTPDANKDVQLQSNLALAYHKAGDYQNAVQAYKAVYYANPARLAQARINRTELAGDLTTALMALGDAAYKKGDLDAAVSHYGDASLYSAQNDIRPYLGLGNAYFALNIPDKAYGAYGEVLARDPGNVTARLYRIRLEMAHAVQNASDHTGNATVPEGVTPAQLATLEGLAKESPNNVEVLAALADAYAQQARANEAIAVYERAVPLDAKNPALLMAIGSQWQKLGNFEQAKNAYLRALALDDKRPDLHYNLGIVYNELGDFERSAAAYRQALTLAPDSTDSRYGLAITLEKQGHREEALEAYQAYAGNPAAPYYQEALERIQALRQAKTTAAQPDASASHSISQPAVSLPKTSASSPKTPLPPSHPPVTPIPSQKPKRIDP